jgi:hypothetical protein
MLVGWSVLGCQNIVLYLNFINGLARRVEQANGSINCALENMAVVQGDWELVIYCVILLMYRIGWSVHDTVSDSGNHSSRQLGSSREEGRNEGSSCGSSQAPGPWSAGNILRMDLAGVFLCL